MIEKENKVLRIKDDYEWPEMTASELQALHSLTWLWLNPYIEVLGQRHFNILIRSDRAIPEYTYELEQLAKKYPKNFATGIVCKRREYDMEKFLRQSASDNFDSFFSFTFYNLVTYGKKRDGDIPILDTLGVIIWPKLHLAKQEEERLQKLEFEHDSKVQAILFWVIMIPLTLFLAFKCS